MRTSQRRLRGGTTIERHARSEAEEARHHIRAGEWTGPTLGLAPGFVQANLVVLPQELATDFERYCSLNPAALPLLETTGISSPVPKKLAPTADLRTDLPRYRLYRRGRLIEDPTDIVTLWRSNYVAFLIGCSFTFDNLLHARGITARPTAVGGNVPMFVTNRMTHSAGAFSGPLVVSMRAIAKDDIARAIELTRAMPTTHGAPLQVGAPEDIGISDLSSPDYGVPLTVEEGEVPAFWSCGVTTQAAAVHSKIRLMITHAPGHMFITDRPLDEHAG